MLRSLYTLLLLLAGVSSCQADTGAGTEARAGQRVDLLVRDATIVDVLDGTLHPHRTIAIRGDRIAAIVSEADAAGYEAAKTIEAAGKYAIPGLWDMHVHFGGGRGTDRGKPQSPAALPGARHHRGARRGRRPQPQRV